jgi:peptidyl-tRNA hydrolase
LAYLIFLAVEVGIVTERKAKRVHEYIISHVSTTETEKISEKSFSNGYYVPNSVDIGIVSDKLAQMLAKAQGQY